MNGSITELKMHGDSWCDDKAKLETQLAEQKDAYKKASDKLKQINGEWGQLRTTLSQAEKAKADLLQQVDTLKGQLEQAQVSAAQHEATV